MAIFRWHPGMSVMRTYENIFSYDLGGFETKDVFIEWVIREIVY